MNAATEAATTTAAAKPPRTWTARRSDEVVLQVWRVIANSGQAGISPADIRDRLNNMDPDLLKMHLHELRRKGHIRYHSATASLRYGCWIATATPPATEDVPLWITNLAESQNCAPDHQAEQERQRADDVLAAARLVPNSAFALGGQCAAFGVDIDAVHMPAEHKQALADAAPPAAAPAPAPGEPAATVEEPAADPAAELDAAEEAAGPLFAMYSDKTLGLLLANDRHLVLTQDETRALFAFLDSLMAIGHGSLSEAAS